MNDNYSRSGYREFDDFSNVPVSGPGSGYQPPQASLREISENVQHFCNNLSTLERRIRLLHTSQDNSRLRQEIIGLSSDTVQLAKIADTAVRKVKKNTRSLSQAEKLQFDKLVNTFSSSVSKFQDIQKMTADLEQEMLTKARSSSFRRTSPDSGNSLPESEREDVRLVDHDNSTQVQAQALDDSDALLVEQREREMRQLEHDIVDINEIFRDLGTIVHDQGEMIDNIEVNVENAAGRVEEGNKQLEKSVAYKRCSRKLTIIIVCVVSVVVVVVLIVSVILLCTLSTVCRPSGNN